MRKDEWEADKQVPRFVAGTANLIEFLDDTLEILFRLVQIEVEIAETLETEGGMMERQRLLKYLWKLQKELTEAEAASESDPSTAEGEGTNPTEEA